MLKKLEKSLLKAPVIKRGDYNYFIHPITDGIPRLEPSLLREISSAIIEIADLDVDLIVTIEAMGIHISTMLSDMTEIPVNIIRKKQYWLPNEVILDQKTGYSGGKLYLNWINKGDRVCVIDSVISTGGTMIAALNGLKKVDADIKDVIAVIERGDGVKRVKKETGFDVKTLVKVDVVDNKVKILEEL